MTHHHTSDARSGARVRAVARLAPAWRRAVRLALVLAASAPSAGTAADHGPMAGSRLVLYAASASVRGSYEELVPTAGGAWRDPNTGQTFDTQAVATASGHGFTVVDVAYRDATVCVGSAHAFGLDPLSNLLTTLSSEGFVTGAGECGDYWVPPARLAAWTPRLDERLTVSRGPLAYLGRTFDTLGVASRSPGASSHHVYDAVSGYLLFSGSSTTGADLTVPGPFGQSQRGPGNTLLTHTSLRDVRARVLPSVSAALPRHVRDMTRLEYRGVRGTRFMGQSLDLPMAQRVDRVDGGDAWVLLSATRHVHDPITGVSLPETFAVVIAAAQLGGVFAAPELLAALAVGWADDDPVTGMRMSVVHADDRVVVVQRRLSGELAEWVYDRASGWLLATSVEQQVGLGTMFARLELTSVR